MTQRLGSRYDHYTQSYPRYSDEHTCKTVGGQRVWDRAQGGRDNGNYGNYGNNGNRGAHSHYANHGQNGNEMIGRWRDSLGDYAGFGNYGNYGNNGNFGGFSSYINSGQNGNRRVGINY